MFKNCVIKPSVNTEKWLKAAAVRAVKTMAQTALSVISTSALLSDVNWGIVVSSVILSGMGSMLTSVAGIPEVTEQEEN